MSESRCELWTPGKTAIGLAKAACLDPDDGAVVHNELPKDANLNTGTGIPDGALVLSRSQLKYIKFPLHPLFQFVWIALDLHPMQLSPNSYLQLSAFLAFGLQEGVCIFPWDFFHFHDCVPTPDKGDYFHFTSKTNCKLFVKKPSSHKNWKRQPLVITGNWAAPEVKYLKIRSTFATSAARFPPIHISERIQLLKTCFAGKCLDIEKYSTEDILLQISQERSGIIYSHFQLFTHVKPTAGLEGKELAKRIVDSVAIMDAGFSACPEHVAEWESMRKRVEKRNKSGETDEAVHCFEDPDTADLDQVEPMMARQPSPLPYSLPSKPSRLDKKRSGSSPLWLKKRIKSVYDPSAHSSRTCLEPIRPPTFSSLKSIPLNKKKNVALEKDDGTYVTEEEEVVGNRGACFDVFPSLCHAADASALQKKAPQDIMEDSELQMMTAIEQRMTQLTQKVKVLTDMNETKDEQLKGLEAKLEKIRSQLHTEQELRKKVQCRLSKLKMLRKKKYARDLKFKNAEKRILMESVRLLKFKKIVANPDVLDDKHRPKPGNYEYSDGMKPSEEDEVEQDDEEDPEDEDDQDEENDQEEDDPKDEDDQAEEDDPEDEGEQGGNDDHDQDECSLGGRDVDNNLSIQNSNMIRVETSPNRNHLPLQSNQETSDPALLFDSGLNNYADPIHLSSLIARPSCEHVPEFSHMECVSSGFGFQNQNELGVTAHLEGGGSQNLPEPFIVWKNDEWWSALLEDT